jgi:hypothetical protein
LLASFSTTEETPDVLIAVVLKGFDHSVSAVSPMTPMEAVSPEAVVSATLNDARCHPIKTGRRDVFPSTGSPAAVAVP